MPSTITTEINSGVAVLTLDDGKVNALSHTLIDDFHTALDRALEEAEAVVIVGRPGRFSGGFDLSVMKSGAEDLRRLVRAGADLLLRIATFPHPVVVACTGHALAAGALVLLTADLRIGIRGPFKIGLNEVSIGMPLPIFAVEMARARLAPTHLTRATVLAEIFDPEAAVEAGYLDRVVDPEEVVDHALAEAERLKALGASAFATTRSHLRSATVDLIRRTLDDDVATLGAL